MAGLDPAAAWDRTPGELLEYIEAYHERMERQAYMLYNLASTISHMIFGKTVPAPWQAFPNAIRPEMQVMDDDDIYQSCLAWCGRGT